MPDYLNSPYHRAMQRRLSELHPIAVDEITEGSFRARCDLCEYLSPPNVKRAEATKQLHAHERARHHLSAVRAVEAEARVRDLEAQLRSRMTEFSCNVRVLTVTPHEFGATALVQFEQGGGIDISPTSMSDGLTALINITEDVQFVTQGALLRLALSDQPNAG